MTSPVLVEHKCLIEVSLSDAVNGAVCLWSHHVDISCVLIVLL